jgi:hypothetical protein
MVRDVCRAVHRVRWLGIVSAAVFAPQTLTAQGDAEVVRGRVLSAQAARPVALAEVLVTGENTGFSQRARTDRNGAFLLVFADGEHQYRISVRAIGYTMELRVSGRSGLSNNIVVPDIILHGSSGQLATLVANARPNVPALAVGRPNALEQNLLNSALFVFDPSSLNSLALQSPGVMAGTDSSFSVLGAASNQNSMTADGLQLAGSVLPRDAIASAGMRTVSVDPAQGDFSGAQVSVTTQRGTSVFEATIRGQSVQPLLTWSDPRAVAPDPQLSWASGFMSGTIGIARTSYRLAFQGSSRIAANVSLLSASDAVLLDEGLSREVVASVHSTLDAIGVATNLDNELQRTSLRTGALSLRADRRLGSTSALTLNALGNWSATTGGGTSPLALPTTGSRQSRALERVGVSAFTYLAGAFEQLRVAYTHSTYFSVPQSRLPTGLVEVGTQFATGESGLSTLTFGGNGAGQSGGETRTLEFRNSVSVTPGNGRHQIEFMQALRITVDSSARIAGAGSYLFASMGDLASGHAESYTSALPPSRGRPSGPAWRCRSAMSGA